MPLALTILSNWDVTFGLPQQLTDAGPYVLTLVVLILVSRRFRKSREAVLA